MSDHVGRVQPRSVVDAFAQVAPMFFRLHPRPATLPPNGNDTCNAGRRFAGNGTSSSELPLCACAVSVSRLPDLTPRLSQALEARGSCVPRFTLMCVSLATPRMPARTRKVFRTHLVRPGVLSAASCPEYQAARKPSRRQEGKIHPKTRKIEGYLQVNIPSGRPKIRSVFIP